jgi:Glycosyl transferases group 1
MAHKPKRSYKRLGSEDHEGVRLWKSPRPQPRPQSAEASHARGFSPAKPPSEAAPAAPAPTAVSFRCGGPTGIPARPGALPGRFNIAIIGQFGTWPWGQHPDEAYLADEMAALGAHVLRIDQDRQVIAPRGVDWAVFTAHERSRSRIPNWRRACPTLLWTLDWLPSVPGREYVIDAARRVSLFVTSDRYDWARLGIAHHKYLPGACEGHVPAFSPAPWRTCAFAGTVYSERRRAIAEIIRSAGGEVLDHPGSWVYGNRLARFVQETKVMVGDNYRNDIPGYWSSRNYVIPGAGGFLLASRVPGIEDAFTPGEHLGVYGSLDDLPAEIDRWVKDDAGRERVRRSGFLHVRSRHGWRERAAALLALMGYRL